MSETPAGLILICNDLGEIEQVPLDGLGLLPVEASRQGKAGFLRLVERESLEQARAFLTDLRINRKVSDRELSIQTQSGPLKIVFAGLKTGSQFVIVAAKTAQLREKLFAQALPKTEPQPEQQVEQKKPRIGIHQLNSRLEAETAETQPVPASLSKPEKTTAELERARKDLERVRQDFYELALVDTLTGLYNRRHFVKRLKEELREAERYKRSPAFLLLDIDNFKSINENHGLRAGDVILRSMAEVMQGVLRQVDLIGRLGGDEFGALLHETTPESSLRAARRLQKKLTEVSIEVDGRIFQITVSIALIHIAEGKSRTADRLLKEAEDLLKRAKAAGNNTILHQ
jgi:diguanylate cyclase (GGDEF)-like protein